MAKVTDKISPPIKMLLMGDAGSGKTGSLMSLAAAGYRLWFVDFDNGTDIIRNLSKQAPAARERIDIETFRDNYHMLGGKPSPKTANSWMKACQYIEKIHRTLGPDDVLVIDSLSMAGKAALRWVLQMNGRLALHPQLQDWGEAQNLIESLVGMLTDDDLPMNVICTAHIKWLEDNQGAIERGFPDAPGRALSPVLGRYFNHQLAVSTIGDGKGLKRSIHTSPIKNLELKNANPAVVKDTYPLASGMAEYFAAIRGTTPAVKPTATVVAITPKP